MSCTAGLTECTAAVLRYTPLLKRQTNPLIAFRAHTHNPASASQQPLPRPACMRHPSTWRPASELLLRFDTDNPFLVFVAALLQHMHRIPLPHSRRCLHTAQNLHSAPPTTSLLASAGTLPSRPFPESNDPQAILLQHLTLLSPPLVGSELWQTKAPEQCVHK